MRTKSWRIQSVQTIIVCMISFMLFNFLDYSFAEYFYTGRCGNERYVINPRYIMPIRLKSDFRYFCIKCWCHI